MSLVINENSFSYTALNDYYNISSILSDFLVLVFHLIG